MNVLDSLSTYIELDCEVKKSTSPRTSLDDFLNKLAVGVFRVASYLTEPICKTHEIYRRICVVEALNPEAGRLSNLVRKIAYFIALIGWASLATFTVLPGIALRALASFIQTDPFIQWNGEADGKVLPPDGTFSLLSWNICCVGAGYAISDGGVFPWSSRIDKVVDKIIEQDADVNCLYETFDSSSAFYVCEKLKQSGYTHFYFNIGPKSIGVSSGILVASKYSLKNPEFTLFPQDSLIGRTKNAAKGVFSFDLESRSNLFARVYSTHLQHSEEPQFPTEEEIEARRKQMDIILGKLKDVQGRCVIVTGDLNLDDDEYSRSSWHTFFQKGDHFLGKTWGGDEFCARLVGKQISGPLNLDHTMIVNGSAQSIHTSLVETGYEASKLQEDALSDHAGLFSRIYSFRLNGTQRGPIQSLYNRIKNRGQY